MTRCKNFFGMALVLSMLFTFSACGTSPVDNNKSVLKAEATPVTKIALTISAAASLKDALNEIKDIYANEKSSVSVTYNYGSSGSLQQQIENGAPADIFISAAKKQMDALQDKKLILEETRDLLGNKLVVVVLKDNQAIADFKDLANEKMKKVGLGELKTVPSGQYAQEVFTKLGVFEKVKAKAVFAKDVREILSWVESGNADAGVVYETDAKISTKVKIVAYAPEGSHKPILYPTAVVKASKNIEPAKEFLKFLSEDQAKAIFLKYGFTFLNQ